MSFNTMMITNQACLEQVGSFDFDCIAVSEVLGRENTLPLVASYCLQNLPKQPAVSIINEEKMTNFLQAIGQGYRRSV